MKAQYLMGIDLGSSLVKAAVYDLDDDCVAAVEKPAPSEHPRPDVFLQSGEDFLKIALSAAADVVEKSGIEGSAVAAIGFSGQMGGAIGIDAHFNAVTEWSNPLDSRYMSHTAHMLHEAGQQILRQSGSNAPYFAPKILWFKQDFPEVYRRVAKFVFLAGFVAGRMAGLGADDAFVDRTYLEMSGIADIPQNKWSDELCDRFDIGPRRLPRIIESTSIIGRLTKEAADACGLISGIPLVAGAGDKPAGYIGAGIVKPGLLIDEAATFAALSLCVDRYVPDLEFRTLENIPSPIPGLYFPTMILIGSGATHKWFRDTFAGKEQDEAARAGVSAFEILDRRAAGVQPGSGGLLAIGMLGGRGYPSDPDVRGLFMGFSFDHKKEHFYRALLESFAYEYGYALKVMRKSYPDVIPTEVRVIGGGAASDLWNQIKSDVTGLPYVRLGTRDYALRGDALIAGAGVGVYTDLQRQAAKLEIRGKEYRPNEANHRQYEKYVKLYENLFDRLRGSFQELRNLDTDSSS